MVNNIHFLLYNYFQIVMPITIIIVAVDDHPSACASHTLSAMVSSYVTITADPWQGSDSYLLTLSEPALITRLYCWSRTTFMSVVSRGL